MKKLVPVGRIKEEKRYTGKTVYTYTIKLKKSPCNLWEIFIVPRNGKAMRIARVYRSKATAEFVAKKMEGAMFRYESRKQTKKA